ncbi:hypothetical protein [Kitasatospora azatica]|uniref:hypothetical protein n=1 Tax=Kitasatospora azatica TaxID=58347 RepID=UPI000AE09F1C|nr:hypothetical protein [Kitasatospora azatica]
MMDRLKSMFGDHSEKATQTADTAKERAADAGQQAAEHMPGPAADALGNITGKAAQPGDADIQQAESNMESEGGHEWEK